MMQVLYGVCYVVFIQACRVVTCTELFFHRQLPLYFLTVAHDVATVAIRVKQYVRYVNECVVTCIEI